MKPVLSVKLKKASFLTALFLFSISAFSQQFNWANTLTAKQLQIATNENTGDVYISGTFEDSLVMRSSALTTSVLATNSGFREAFVAKLDAFGGIDWLKTFGGTPSAIFVNEMILDHSGAILLAGRFSDSTDFAPGLPVHTRTAFSSSDGYVLKLDSAGNFEWVTQVEAYASATNFKGLVVDDSNNVYFSANFVNNYGIVIQSNNSFDMIISERSIIKLDQNGDFDDNKELWYNVTDFHIDGTNNLVLFGNYIEQVYDPKETYDKICIEKLSKSFNRLWVITKFRRGPINQHLLRCDKSTNEVFLIYPHNNNHKHIEKVDSNGLTLWNRSIEYGVDVTEKISFVNSLDVNTNGELTLCGGFKSGINLKQDQSNFLLVNNSSGFQSFMARYSAQGDVLWANKNAIQKTTGLTNTYSNLSNMSNNIIAVGNFSGVTDLDPNYTGFSDTASFADKFFIQSFDYCNIQIVNDTIDTCSFTVSPTNSGVWKHSGIYHEVFPSSSGCDSIVSYQANIHLDSVINVIRSCESVQIAGPSMVWNTGVYNVYKQNALGCDSVFVYDYTRYPKYAYKPVIACHSYASHDSSKIWTVSGTYYDTIPRDTICDLIETIVLTIKNDINVDLFITETRISAMRGIGQGGANFQWLDCDNNMTPIPNETKFFFEITKSANVAVEVTEKYNPVIYDAVYCSDTSRCVQVTDPYYNSVEKLNANEGNYILYPNPTHNAVTISWGEHKEKLTIRLRNTLGQVVYESTTSGTSKNIEFNLAKGVYLLEIEEEGNNVFVQKLIVN